MDNLVKRYKKQTEYWLLDYIQRTSAPSTTSINTGFDLDLSSVTAISFSLKFRATSTGTTTSNKILYTGSSFAYFQGTTGGKFGFYVNTIPLTWGSFDTNIHILECERLGLNKMLEVDFDGVGIGGFAAGTSSSGRIYLGSLVALEVYSFLGKEDGITTVDLVPVKRKVDNAVGMYDKVNKTFISTASMLRPWGAGNIIGEI